MINAQGVRTTVADNIPSSQTSAGSGGLVSGVADVAFIGDTLYGVLAGAGCSHGVQGTPNGVIRVNADHTWSVTADLGAFQKANPVAHPEPDDFEPDGTWYSLIAVQGDLYAVEPNHGELDKITTQGQISRVIDISASQGHIVPTAMAYHDGNFYVGNLRTFPIVAGSSKIYEITPAGQIRAVVQGLTTVLGVTFDDRGRMYVLENTTNNAFPTPGTGRVVRVDASGGLEVIASGLFLPTAMTFGPDGKLYVSNVGFGPPPVGLGQILRIDIPPDLPAGVTIESLPADPTRLTPRVGRCRRRMRPRRFLLPTCHSKHRFFQSQEMCAARTGRTFDRRSPFSTGKRRVRLFWLHGSSRERMERTLLRFESLSRRLHSIEPLA